MTHAQLLKLLLNWARTQLAEKLAPKKAEPSQDKVALDKIKALLTSYDLKYADTVDVREVYNAILEITCVETVSPLAVRKPFQPNPITAKYVSKYVGATWAWPGIVGPADLWYKDQHPPIPTLLYHFKRVGATEKGLPGDIVVFDTRIGNGYGATGFLVEDKTGSVRVLIDDVTSLQYRIIGKGAVLGYFRPKNTEKA